MQRRHLIFSGWCYRTPVNLKFFDAQIRSDCDPMFSAAKCRKSRGLLGAARKRIIWIIGVFRFGILFSGKNEARCTPIFYEIAKITVQGGLANLTRASIGLEQNAPCLRQCCPLARSLSILCLTWNRRSALRRACNRLFLKLHLKTRLRLFW